jgi:hypothetical protein
MKTNKLNLIQLGAFFGITSKKLGEILDKENLRNPKTKIPNKLALSKGVANVINNNNNDIYLILGAIRFGKEMRIPEQYSWNLKNATPYIEKYCKQLSEIDFYIYLKTKEIKNIYKLYVNGQDKFALLSLDKLWADIPKQHYDLVRGKVELNNLINIYKKDIYGAIKFMVLSEKDPEAFKRFSLAIETYHPEYKARMEGLMILL